MKSHYNNRNRYQWTEISVGYEEGIRYLFTRELVDRTTDDIITFRIGFMLPQGAVVNRRVDKVRMNAGEMNHLSLFCVIELNRVRYIFAGDLSDLNIQFLDEAYLSNCRFVKIPHHGSKEPIKLVDKLLPISHCKTHSVTTVFGSSHPYESVLREYAMKFDGVFSTERGENYYGLVDICYGVKEFKEYSVVLEGNAVEYGRKHISYPPVRKVFPKNGY